jgi:hypothetical protein
MYVRKKPNRSSSTSVVIVDKSSGKVRYLKTIGVSRDENVLADLYRQGEEWISTHRGGNDMFVLQAGKDEEQQVSEYFLSNIENILLNGTQLILNSVFKSVGFDIIEDEVLRHLVIARLCQPSSKIGTVDYLKSYFDEVRTSS